MSGDVYLRCGMDDLDLFLDQLDPPLMSWQRRVIHHVVSSRTPDQLFCFLPPREQIRSGLDYRALMEHYSVEVIRNYRDT